MVPIVELYYRDRIELLCLLVVFGLREDRYQQTDFLIMDHHDQNTRLNDCSFI